MEIPLNTQVNCIDGVCGRSELILINPVMNKVTHLVVKEDTTPNTEYIVPIELMTKTVADKIFISCSKADLKKMKPFIKTQFIEEEFPQDKLGSYGMYGMYGMGTLFYFPYTISDSKIIESVKLQQIPLGELAFSRGSRVEAADGFIGKVDEFVIDAKTDQITHLVMREGHFWGKKDVIIPVSAIRKSADDGVHLKLNKHEIEALPAFPLKRDWS